jgi:hypothetical protein
MDNLFPDGLKFPIFVRKDLRGSHRTVQATHAAIEFALAFHDHEKFTRWNRFHKTVVIFGHEGETFGDLFEVVEAMVGKIKYFREPDMSNVMTAFAIMPMSPTELDSLCRELEKGLYYPDLL